jgi:hypothetical protein
MITLFVIHLGNHFPHYIRDCIRQIRLHNSKDRVAIKLIVHGNANFAHAEELEQEYAVEPVYVEDLPITSHYMEFLSLSQKLLDLGFRQKYSQYILERYFVWEAYLMKNPLSNTYFIESDNLLYVSMETVQTTESLFVQEMAMPYDTLERGAPSFVFARRAESLTHFNRFLVESMKLGITDDMDIYGRYRKAHPEKMFAYPVVPAVCNVGKTERTNRIGQRVPSRECGFLCDSRFPMIFDSVVYGQAVSGIDPRNTNAQQSVGYINEKALFSITETEFGWTTRNGLWVPIANQLPVVNLHIHSKALSNFVSDTKTVPSAQYNPSELLTKIVKDYS